MGQTMAQVNEEKRKMTKTKNYVKVYLLVCCLLFPALQADIY